jgi:hypothetical protein
MKEQVSHTIELAEVAERYISEFSAVFHRNMIKMEENDLINELQCYSARIDGLTAVHSTSGA